MTEATDQPSKTKQGLGTILGLLILVFFVAGVTPSALRLFGQIQFKQRYDEIIAILESWETPPPGADPEEWKNCWGATTTATANVCFSKNLVTQAEMDRLLLDMQARQDAPNSWKRLEWYWHRLAETGPHGKKYITNFEYLWNDGASPEHQLTPP
ncbi:hypothetical protein [Bremerella cremea]|uniref:hypothetical protein n=1 Tax=Bremerella cremea TaxID=1031537 RepID=UPI0031E7BAD1